MMNMCQRMWTITFHIKIHKKNWKQICWIGTRFLWQKWWNKFAMGFFLEFCLVLLKGNVIKHMGYGSNIPTWHFFSQDYLNLYVNFHSKNQHLALAIGAQSYSWMIKSCSPQNNIIVLYDSYTFCHKQETSTLLAKELLRNWDEAEDVGIEMRNAILVLEPLNRLCMLNVIYVSALRWFSSVVQ